MQIQIYKNRTHKSIYILPTRNWFKFTPYKTKALFTIMTVMWLRLWCNSAMWLQPEINTFIFLRRCTRLQPITMQGVVDQLWRHCFRPTLVFYIFRFINKNNLSFAVISSFNYVDFMLWNWSNVWNRRQKIKIWQNYDVTGWLTGFVAVTYSYHSCITVIIANNA